MMKTTNLTARTWLILIISGILFSGASAAFASSDDPLSDGEYAAAIVMDVSSGDVLFEKEIHLQRQPASMVKMMTELLILKQIEEGSIALHDTVTVSAKSSRMGGSQVYLKQGEEFTVEQLLMALAIHSANDAAVALAEFHSGSTEAFVDLMNMEAVDLGMNETVFRSVHGLPPDWNQEPDLTSAYDMAILARKLIEHPLALVWSNQSTAPFRDGEFTLYNPNKLIGKYRGLDGLKTGYHSRAGYCVTATAIQKGRRLISVVMGTTSDRARATETTRLLSYGFNMFIQLVLIEQNNHPIEQKLRVKGGKAREVALAYSEPLSVCVRRTQTADVILENRLTDKIEAPVKVGQIVGTAVAMIGSRTLGEVSIIATEAVPKGSFFQQLFNR